MSGHMTVQDRGEANDCEHHHFVWTWPIEGGEGSVGICDLCGGVTTTERDAKIRAEAAREAIDPHCLRCRRRIDRAAQIGGGSDG